MTVRVADESWYFVCTNLVRKDGTLNGEAILFETARILDEFASWFIKEMRTILDTLAKEGYIELLERVIGQDDGLDPEKCVDAAFIAAYKGRPLCVSILLQNRTSLDSTRSLLFRA